MAVDYRSTTIPDNQRKSFTENKSIVIRKGLLKIVSTTAFTPFYTYGMRNEMAANKTPDKIEAQYNILFLQFGYGL